jgi:Tfp pilus assembly protein PilP
MRKLLFIFVFIFVFTCFFRQVNSFATSYPYYLKRDPFQTFLYTQKHVTSFKAGELPLLQYGISSLKVVGIMNRRDVNARRLRYFAMIQTPDNRSYIITVGSLVGVNRARVVSISGSEVNLIERTYNILGQMRSTNVVMGLK